MDLVMWPGNSSAQKLWQAFMLFTRANWHQRSSAGQTHAEIRLLFCILRVHKMTKPGQPPMKVSDISKKLHVTAPAITQMLNSLEAKGLVERHLDPADRRAVYVTLTAKGEEIVKLAGKGMLASFQGLVDYLGEKESNQLAESLIKAQTYFNEQRETPEQTYLREVFMNEEAGA